MNRILIIGAGPTGLGAAYRLQELGYNNWAIYEKNSYIGGLAASFKDDKGFTWDIGGHVMFSHYKYYDKLINKLLGSDYLEHERESWIWALNSWVPYPFQNNIRYLSKEKLLECIMGLIEARNNSGNSSNFKEWILNTFGKGIAEYFMFPYNSKIWAYPLDIMDKNWIAERVSVVDIKRVLRNIIFNRDDISWGPNAKFKFPLYGGTGGLFKRFEHYIKDHLNFKKRLLKINLKEKLIYFSNGTREKYDILINTSSLDEFIKKIEDAPNTVKDKSKELIFNSVYIVGIGLKKKLNDTKCWMYFPEKNSPFYRVTHFSNYSPNNVPDGDTNNYCSYMCETAFSKFNPVDKEQIIEETIQGLINSKMITEEHRKLIISTYLIEATKAYPIPTLRRDEALSVIQPFLEKHTIFSRGRFGAWKYEVGNMDHSVMQGVEVIDRILEGKREKTNYVEVGD